MLLADRLKSSSISTISTTAINSVDVNVGVRDSTNFPTTYNTTLDIGTNESVIVISSRARCGGSLADSTLTIGGVSGTLIHTTDVYETDCFTDVFFFPSGLTENASTTTVSVGDGCASNSLTAYCLNGTSTPIVNSTLHTPSISATGLQTALSTVCELGHFIWSVLPSDNKTEYLNSYITPNELFSCIPQASTGTVPKNFMLFGSNIQSSNVTADIVFDVLDVDNDTGVYLDISF